MGLDSKNLDFRGIYGALTMLCRDLASRAANRGTYSLLTIAAEFCSLFVPKAITWGTSAKAAS
jgi:hypothetical protein